MAKKVIKVVKLQVPAGKANPAPPIGPALGQAGVNIMQFCKEFNARTADQAGLIIPVVITVFEDRSFTFETKTPPAAVLLRIAAGIEKGSGEPNKQQGRDGQAQQSARNRRAEDAGPERGFRRSRDADGRRNGPQHGHCCRRLMGFDGFRSRSANRFGERSAFTLVRAAAPRRSERAAFTVAGRNR